MKRLIPFIVIALLAVPSLTKADQIILHSKINKPTKATS
jgi:hypothetical protein